MKDESNNEKVALMMLVKDEEMQNEVFNNFTEKLKKACFQKLETSNNVDNSNVKVVRLKNRISLFSLCEDLDAKIVLMFGLQGVNVGLNFNMNAFESTFINNVHFIYVPDIKTILSDTVNRSFEKKLWNTLVEKMEQIKA